MRGYRALAICSALSAIAASIAWAGEKKMDIKDVPAAVRATIEQQAKGGTIIDVDVSDDSGEQVYTSEIHKNGKEFDVQVSAKGKLLSKEPGDPSDEKTGAEADVEGGGKHKAGSAAAVRSDKDFSQSFFETKSDLGPTGRNTFFVLEPGHKAYFEGTEDGKKTTLVVSVLDETKQVDGVETRIVEERESVEGKVVEVSRNYFAFSKRTSNIYYFGEAVDMYKNGEVTGHGGSWESGVKGAHYGLFMAATPLLGSRHFQEYAPGTAMDRVENVSLSDKLQLPSGTYSDCLKTEETTPLEPGNKEYKFYAPNVGLVKDGALGLVRTEPAAK